MTYDMLGFAPAKCEPGIDGHFLKEDGEFIPGAINGGWATCTCPAARAHGGGWGHHYVECVACSGQGVRRVFYNPPCSMADDVGSVPSGSRVPGEARTGTPRG